MFKVGLVGIGDAGAHHARALTHLQQDGSLAWTAVCARDPARLSAFPASDATARFTSLDALLGARVCDALILATPDGLHPAQVMQCAAAGVHVLVEKPLALTRPDAERAVDAARAANVHLAVGYHLRHHAAHRLALTQRAELVGNLRTVFVRWAWPDPSTSGWRATGQDARFWSLAALGTHGIDLALMFSGDASVDRVSSVLEPPTGMDRAAEVSFRLQSGVLVHISVSIAHRAISRVLLTGDAGEVEALGTLGARGDGELFHRAPRQPPRALSFEPIHPYTEQLRHFILQAPSGFVKDPALLANLDVLDCILPPGLEGAP